MDVFDLRERVIGDYESFVRSFLQFRDLRIEQRVAGELADGHLWPEPRLGLNPSFDIGGTVGSLVDNGTLHPTCREIFRAGKQDGPGTEIRLHRHQTEAIEAARRNANYVLTTGTGSGKSLSYIVPIVDHVLRVGSGGGIKAIVVYPMNALANSQREELDKFLDAGFDGHRPVTYARYTGQETREEKDAILRDPPDILLTNYVMLELILTRVTDRKLIDAASNLRFLVLDELHTYRGRQGADVSFLVRRLREACGSEQLRCVGTSATMATGSFEQRRRAVAEVASELFGAQVDATDVIGETLQRASPEIDLTNPTTRSQLIARIRSGPPSSEVVPEAFLADPMTSWIESTFGIERVEGRWERVTPRPIGGPLDKGGAAAELADVLELDRDTVERAIKQHLMVGSQVRNPVTGFNVFAFRLHQFISRGDTVHASIERPTKRYLTLREQRTVPQDPSKVLLPLCFCRGCGQEYYSVYRDELAQPSLTLDEEETPPTGDVVVPRALGERAGEPGQTAGYLYIPPDDPARSNEAWSSDPNEVLERIPPDWVDHDREPSRVKSSHKDHLPQEMYVSTDGGLGGGPTRAWWVPAPFRFCLACGIAYGGRLRSDATKLATLGSGGRSSAMTELSISSVRWLRNSDLPPRAQKLLAFTDNRQDASLQAGHFNDFVMVTMVRAALVRALEGAGTAGLRHDELPLEVFRALDLPLDVYSSNPEVRFAAREEVDRTMRDVLAYLLYRDLERGWRVTQPNLEQSGLLRVGYASLDALCSAEDVWASMHPALVTASPQTRATICQVVCDHLRRSLVIDVDVLDPVFQEQMVRRSDQYLKEPFDPLRIARPPVDGLRTNEYFRDLYRSLSKDLTTLTAKEHTAQVRAEERILREEQFRKGELPILYCSPTMELGVDISELNVVGMRNVPPTPANYAQRSGRAGRSGQPALVLTYATSGSPHDQYYFQRPDKMVSGRVEAPRIDQRLPSEDGIDASPGATADVHGAGELAES